MFVSGGCVDLELVMYAAAGLAVLLLVIGVMLRVVKLAIWSLLVFGVAGGLFFFAKEQMPDRMERSLERGAKHVAGEITDEASRISVRAAHRMEEIKQRLEEEAAQEEEAPATEDATPKKKKRRKEKVEEAPTEE